MRTYPGVFEIHQDSEDGIVLLFAENQLVKLEKQLRLKKRQVKSEKQRQAALKGLAKIHGTSLQKAQIAPESTNSPQAVSEAT